MDDIFDDIESDIDSDWSEIKKKIDRENHKEYTENQFGEPVIPSYPTYNEFYRTVVELFDDYAYGDESRRVGNFLWRVLRNRDRKVPDSFESVWSMFCDPRSYKYESSKCKGCGKIFTVIIKYGEESRIPHFYGNGRDPDYYMTIDFTRRTNNVCCPSCGTYFLNTTGKVVGIFNE